MDQSKINYDQGYKSNLTREEKIYFRNKFCRKSFSKGFAFMLMNVMSIYALVIISYNISGWVKYFDLTIPIVMVTLIFVTRQIRALENIVHFGSHNNFTSKRDINDFITNLFAAWPVLQDVRQYRKFHATHHGEYGSHVDPCKERLERIGASGIEINNNRQLVLAILIWMPSYVREFYNEVKSSSAQVVIFLIWHFVTWCILAFFGTWQLATYTVAIWFVAMFLCLPFLRSIAEFSEHDYARGNTVKETTFNNLGLLDHVLLHPAGDAWHALHHLYPTVPWWEQGRAHRYLMRHDEAYKAALHRDSLLQNIAYFPEGQAIKT